MRFRRRQSRAAATASCAFVVAAAAIFAGPVQARVDKSYTVARTDLPIEIDGKLDDEAWAHAKADRSFHQLFPVENARPSEETVLRVLTDGRFLYVGIRMYDAEPEAMIARQMVQDASQFGDTRINLYIDTFHDKRNGYFFQINPVGTRREGLVENNSDFRMEWNGIWYAASAVDAEGWSAEFKIPFQPLSYAGGDEGVWGFDVERIIRRRNEFIRWAANSQNRTPATMADLGKLRGLTDLEGTGVDLKPSGSVIQRHDWKRDEAFNLESEDDDTKVEPSGDVFYKFHPSMTAVVTANTNFLEAPPDDRRLIISRFPPFLPEQRAFFLQDAAIFEVAELTGAITPFRSRTIGRNSAKQNLDIDAGAKLTGRVGDFNFGGLYVHLPEQKGQDATDLAVVRLQQNVLDGSAMGLVGTFGDPDGDVENGLFGGDFTFFDNELIPDRVVKTNAYALQSVTDGDLDDAHAFGIDFIYPNDIHSGSIRYRDIGQEFNPKLGGVLRTGIREWFTNYRYRVRPGTWLRTVDSEVKLNVVANRDVEIETLKAVWNFATFENNLGDQLIFGWEHYYQDLRREEFDVSPEVTIPLGKYEYDRFRVKAAASVARAIQPTVEFVAGSFYSGTLIQVNSRLELRPSPHLYLSLEYEHNDGDLDEGSFIQRLARVRATVAFTPVISLTNVTQYVNPTGKRDNFLGRLGHSSIFRWEIESGSDLYLIFNYNWVEDPARDRLKSERAEGAVKVSWTFRF